METKNTPDHMVDSENTTRRTIEIEGGFEATIHTADDLSNLPVRSQELDLLLTYLGPLIQPLLQKEKQKR